MAVSKLTEEELLQLQQIQNNNQAIVREFGQIAIAELDLDKRRENAETFLDNLRKAETETAKTLEEKYGRGNINLQSGEFVSEDPIPTGAEDVSLPKLEKQESIEVEKVAKKSSKK